MENSSSANYCKIEKCDDCNGFYLQYRYVRIHVDKSGLLDTLKVIYEYEKYDDEFKINNPLMLKYGVAVISIANEDFKEFRDCVEEASLEVIEIPTIEKFI